MEVALWQLYLFLVRNKRWRSSSCCLNSHGWPTAGLLRWCSSTSVPVGVSHWEGTLAIKKAHWFTIFGKICVHVLCCRNLNLINDRVISVGKEMLSNWGWMNEILLLVIGKFQIDEWNLLIDFGNWQIWWMKFAD